MPSKMTLRMLFAIVAVLGYRVDWKTCITAVEAAAANVTKVDVADAKATAADAKATADVTPLPTPPLTSAESEKIPKRGSAADALSNLDGIIKVHRTDLHKATEVVRATNGFALQKCSIYTGELKTWCTNDVHTLDGAAKEHVVAHNRVTEGLEIAKIAKNSIEAERAQQLALANASAEVNRRDVIQKSATTEIATCSKAVSSAKKALLAAEENQTTVTKERDNARAKLAVAIDGNSDGTKYALSDLMEKESSLIVASKRTFTAKAEVDAKVTAKDVAKAFAKTATTATKDATAMQTKLHDELTRTSAMADTAYKKAISFAMPHGYVKLHYG
jgi:hypothetical protein